MLPTLLGHAAEGIAMVTLLLVRHGEAEGNLEHRFIGQTDVPLTDTGRAQIRTLTKRLVGLPITKVVSSDLVSGNVVVSLDYFKRFFAGLKAMVGGRIGAYEPLLERARREALLRMIESARSRGYHAIVNVRLETARLASSRGDGEGTAGVEMLAFGTALKLARPA